MRKPLGKREAQIIKRLRSVAKMPVTKIALVTERNKTTIHHVLSGKAKFAKRGAKPKLDKKQITHLVNTLRGMIKKAKGRREVTLAMLKKRAKCKVDDKVIRKALLQRNIKFRKMRAKPLLTKKDRQERYDFAEKYRNKSVVWWQQHIHLHIDLKNFPVYTNKTTRDYAAMREVRGAYRAPGQGLDEAYVVVPKDLRYNPGARSCRIGAGVGGGKVLLWHEVGRKWNGKVAASFYEGPVMDALKRGWPKRRSWAVLEDNDPTGFKSKQAESIKKKVHINVFAILKRSPDLNVCAAATAAAPTVVGTAATIATYPCGRRCPNASAEQLLSYHAVCATSAWKRVGAAGRFPKRNCSRGTQMEIVSQV